MLLIVVYLLPKNDEAYLINSIPLNLSVINSYLIFNGAEQLSKWVNQSTTTYLINFTVISQLGIGRRTGKKVNKLQFI